MFFEGHYIPTKPNWPLSVNHRKMGRELPGCSQLEDPLEGYAHGAAHARISDEASRLGGGTAPETHITK